MTNDSLWMNLIIDFSIIIFLILCSYSLFVLLNGLDNIVISFSIITIIVFSLEILFYYLVKSE